MSVGILPIASEHRVLRQPREVPPWGSSTSCVQIQPDIILRTAGWGLPLLQPLQLLGEDIS